MVTSRCLLSKSSCRRGGFLYEPANPPRKIAFRDSNGPAAKWLWAYAVHLTKSAGAAGARKNPQSRKPSPPSHSSPPATVAFLCCSVYLPGSGAHPGSQRAHLWLLSPQVPARLAAPSASAGPEASVQRILPLPQR